MRRTAGPRIPAAIVAAVCVVATLLPGAAGAIPVDSPANLSPNSGAQFNDNPLLTWDPVAGATNYRVQASVQADFSVLLFNVVTVNTAYAYTSEYPASPIYWRVAAQDGGGTGPYASADFERVVDAPVQLTPADLASIAFPGEQPVFSWTSIEFAKSYVLQIDEDINFTSPIEIKTPHTTTALTTTQEYGQTFYWRVRGASGTNGTGIASPWSDTWEYVVTWPELPVLVAPPNTTLESIAQPVFEWTQIVGADTYELQVSLDVNFGAVMVNVTGLTGGMYAPVDHFLNGSYYWRVRAKDVDGHVGSWTAPFAFTRGWPETGVTPGSLQDGVPNPVHPIGAIAQKPYFEWTPVTIASHYEVQVSTSAAFTVSSSCFTLHTRVYEHSGGLATPGACSIFTTANQTGVTRYWRVRAIDSNENIVGLWSPVQSYVYDPAAILKVSPTDGSSVEVPTLTWDAGAMTDTYYVWIYDDTDTLVVQDSTELDSYTPLVHLLTDPLVGETFTWQVTPTNSNPGPGGGWTFTLDPMTTYNLPALGTVEPLDGSLTTVRPRFSWNPQLLADEYRLYRRLQGAPAFVVVQAGIAYPSFTERNGTTLPPGVYEWYVEAYDAADVLIGTGPTSTFEITSPSIPTYLTPTVCLPPAPCTPVPSSPLLSWTPVAGATSYEITLAFDEFFTNISRTYTTPGTTAFIPREELPDNNVGQAYYWYVKPCIDTNCAPEPDGLAVDAGGFQVSSNPVQLTSPADGATVTDEPVLQWEEYVVSNVAATNPTNLGARAYRVQVSTVPSFANTLDNVVTDLTTFTPTTKTYPEGPLYWRVRAIDRSGNELTWSATRTMTKSSPLPTLLAPADGALFTEVPTFSWSPQVGAVTYTLEVYKDGDTNFSLVNRVINITTDQTAYTPIVNLANGTYAWRLRRNDAGNLVGPWSAGRTFTLEAVAATLLAPTDGSTLTTNDVLFEWETLEPASSYRFQRAGVADFSTVAETVTTVMKQWAPTASYPSGVWYWRIQYLDAASNVIGTSPVWSFTRITPQAPGAPTNVTGVAGDQQVTVSWTAPASQGSSPINGYTVTSSPGGFQCSTAGTTSCTVTGLTNGVSYTFTVIASNNEGDSVPSSPSAGLTPRAVPDPPTNVAGTPADNSVDLTWDAPAYNGGAPITSYTATAAPGGQQCVALGSTFCTVVGLTNGVDYTFTVVATNAAGSSSPSAASAVIVPESVPNAPTAVSGVAGNGQVAVTWTAPTDDGGFAITGYTVTSSPGGLQCTTLGTIGCTVTGLTNGQAYSFTVVATNAVGDSSASAASGLVTPIGPPAPPTNVTGVPGNQQVAVSWTAPASNGGSAITGYTVTASPNGAQCTTLGTIGCTITGLTNGLAYTFTVTATNASGTSAPSAPSASITPNVAPTAPGAPTAVTGTPGNQQVAVSWTAPASNGGSVITGYTVTASPGGAQCTTLGTIGCTVTGLTNGLAYTFTVTATNVVGTSAPSAPSASITPRTVPGKPTAVSAVPGDAQAAVSWIAPASTGGSPITGYTATSSPGGLQCTTTGTSCVVSGLTNDVTYTFTVVATNAAGNSAPSNASNAVTPESGLTFTQCGPGKVGPFPDVPGTHLFCEDIEWLVNQNITSGYPDGNFKPSVAVARQSMASFLYRYDGSPAYIPPLVASFSDVPTGYLFFLPIEWLAESGVTGGYPDGTFKPTLNISRAQMAAFLYRFAGEPAFVPPVTPSFSDVPTTHLFYKQIEWLASSGVTGGFADGTFKPGNPVTRQSMAAFLHRFSDLGLG